MSIAVRVVVGVFSVAFLVSSAGFGQPVIEGAAKRSENAASGRVELNLVGSVEQFDRLVPLIPEWFQDSNLRVEIRNQSVLLPENIFASGASLFEVRVWLLVLDQKRARAYFSDPRGKRYLVREIPLRGGLDEIGREQIVQVLVTSAEAFAAHRISSSVAEVVQTFEKTAPVSESKSATPSDQPSAPQGDADEIEDVPHWTARLGALASASLESPKVFAYGPGLILGVRRTTAGPSLSLTAKGMYEYTGAMQNGPVTIATRIAALRVTLATDFFHQAHVNPGLELGAGVDHVTFTPRVEVGSSLAARDSGSDWRPVTLGAFTLGSTYEHWQLKLLMGATLSLFTVHYDVVVGGQVVERFTPWLVQPGMGLEASWQ